MDALVKDIQAIIVLPSSRFPILKLLKYLFLTMLKSCKFKVRDKERLRTPPYPVNYAHWTCSFI